MENLILEKKPVVHFIHFASGEDACTDCELVMEEYPHKFTSKLKGQKVIEHDRCEFEIDVEADDAEV